MIKVNVDKLSSVGVYTILHFYQQDMSVETGFSEWLPTINRIVVTMIFYTLNYILHISQQKKERNKNKWAVLKTEDSLMLQRTRHETLCYL